MIVDLYFGELTPEQVRLIVVFFRGIIYQYGLSIPPTYINRDYLVYAIPMLRSILNRSSLRTIQKRLEKFNLASLSDQILAKILSKLSIYEIMSISCLCKSLNKVTNEVTKSHVSTLMSTGSVLESTTTLLRCEDQKRSCQRFTG